jgi:hypothetical protein
MNVPALSAKMTEKTLIYTAYSVVSRCSGFLVTLPWQHDIVVALQGYGNLMLCVIPHTDYDMPASHQDVGKNKYQIQDIR